jgi:hypothetical protein
MKLFQSLREEDSHVETMSPSGRASRKVLDGDAIVAERGERDGVDTIPPIPPPYFGESKLPDAHRPPLPPSRHRATTTALSLSDMWGASLADISFLASSGALDMQRETGSGWAMFSDTIPAQLESLGGSIISVANLAEAMNSDPDTLAEVLEAHEIKTFTFFGMLHILKAQVSHVTSIFGDDSGGAESGNTEGWNNNDYFGTNVDFDDMPASAPEFSYQTSDEMKDVIMTGFTSSEYPTDSISLTDLAVRWGISSDDINILVDRGLVNATAPLRPSEPWTLPTASLPDIQSNLENALTNVQFIAEMLEKSSGEVHRVLTSVGVKIIRWGSGDFVFSSDVDRAVQACLDNN